MNWFLLALKKYATFDGRSRRKEFWMFLLFYILIAIALAALDALVGFGLLSSVFVLAMLLPSIALAARRLHDTGRSGWWLLLSFVPLLNLLLIYYYLLDSDPGNNAYGPSPKEGTGHTV